MRSAILLLLSLTIIVHLPAAAVLPTVISAAHLDNTCQCECCYQITEYQTECLSLSDAFFEVPTCSQCTVSECSARFPTPCSQPSSVVHAKCTTENTAFFRLVPALFVLATIALLIYGFFFKKFDGYHREQDNNPAANNQARRYNTFHNDSGTSRPSETTKLLSRNSPNLTTLPTINEEEETPSSEHPTTSTPPQSPLPPHEQPTPARQVQPHQSSPPLLHDDTDLDTRISEVATVDSDSTYARDIPLLSEIPQTDPFDADANLTSLDVQHAAEANPSAIFERGVFDIVQQHSEAQRAENKEELLQLDPAREDETIGQTESLPAAPELNGKLMNAETVEQSNSNSDADADDVPNEEDTQAAHVELQPIQQAVDIAKTTEDPAVFQGTVEDQTPKEGHVEPILLDATGDISGIAGSPAHEASDVGTESSPTTHLAAASRADEEPDTSIRHDPERVIVGVPVDVDESANVPSVPSETATDFSEVAHVNTADDVAIVQSELEPVQDIPISETPLIATPDEGTEETVKTEAQTIYNVSDDPTTVDTKNDASVEEMQSEHIEPTGTTPVSEVQIESSAEDMAQRHEPDVPSEVMLKQESLQERRVHDEDRTISLPADEKLTDPSANMAEIVEEAIPDSVPLSEDESIKIVETTEATELSPETTLGIDFPRSAVGIQDEEEEKEVNPVQKSEEEDLQQLSEVIKSESDNSEQALASVEHVTKGQESHAVPLVERESPYAEVSEPVPESEEAIDSSAPVDNNEDATQTETLPPSEVPEDSLIDVCEAHVEDNATAIEPDLQEASQVEVEGQVITTERVENEVSDHQNAPLETLPEVGGFTVEVEQSQLTEDIENEPVALGEQVAETEAEAEALGAEELEPVEHNTGLAERGLETILSQAEETGTSDGATSKDGTLQNANDDEQPTSDSEDVTPPLQDAVMPETTDSLAVDHEHDLNVSDEIATELDGTSSGEDRQQAHQSEDIVDEVSGQENELDSLRSAIAVPESATEEPVDADDVDAGGFEQSIIQEETEQSAVNESIDVGSSITDTLEADKAGSLGKDAEPDMVHIENVERSSSEPEEAEPAATETHDISEIETKSEAFEPEVEEPEAEESSSRETVDVLPLAMEPEAAEPEVVHAVAVEAGKHEPVNTEKEVTEAEAMNTATTKPLNMGATTVKSASAEQVTVGRGIVAVTESENVETTADEPQDYGQVAEQHGSSADSTLEATTDPLNVESILDEAKDFDEEADAQLLGAPEVLEPVGTKEPVVELSTVFEDVEVVDMAAEGSDPGLLDTGSHDVPSVEETLYEPDQAERQESGVAVETAPSEDASESVESEALEIEVGDSTVSQERTSGSGNVEAKLGIAPVTVESLPVAINLIKREEESIEATRVDADISSADTPILSETAEAEGRRSEAIERVEVDDGLLSAVSADTAAQQAQVFDDETEVLEVVDEVVENEVKDSEVAEATTDGYEDETAVPEVMDEVVENEKKDSEVAEATTGGQSTLTQFDEEPRTDESDACEAAETKISQMITVDNAEKEDASTNESTDRHHPDGPNKTDLHTEFQESRDPPGVEMIATVPDPEAVIDECDEVETYTPEPVLPSGSEAGMLERNESLDVEISGSPDHSTFSSESQTGTVEEGSEPAGPSSLYLSEDVGENINVTPGVAVPLAELEAAEAGAASDVLDGDNEYLPTDLSPPENKLAEEHISMSASTEAEGTAKEENIEEARAIAELYDNLSLQVPIDVSATSTKVDAAVNLDLDTSTAYSPDDLSEATPQILDVSESTLTDNKESAVVGYVQHSMEKPLVSAKERGSLNEMALNEVTSAFENADQQ